MFKVSALLCVTLIGVYADVGPGQNAYLPPDKGYHYNKPTVTFTTPTRPPTKYTPPPYTPTTKQTYVPSRPPTRPSTRPPTYVPPPTPTRPTYGPPPPTPSRPTYGPPPPSRPTRPPTRPTQPPHDLDGFPSDGHGHEHEHDHHHEPGMPFDFTYSVNDVEHGNDYSHNAVSDGDVTRGEYRVQLPDGRLQVVRYTADWKHGFHAQVTYEGQPTYPNFQGSASNQKSSGYKY